MNQASKQVYHNTTLKPSKDLNELQDMYTEEKGGDKSVILGSHGWAIREVMKGSARDKSQVTSSILGVARQPSAQIHNTLTSAMTYALTGCSLYNILSSIFREHIGYYR